MAKTTQTTEISTTKVDPRVRMKEIRAEVASFLQGYNPKGLSHLGDLPQDMPDARRVIIAVQDLLDIEVKKHKKATEHVAGLVQGRKGRIEYIEYLYDVVQKQVLQIKKLIQLLECSNDTSIGLHKAWRTAEQQRDSVLTTFKMVNGVQNG